MYNSQKNNLEFSEDVIQDYSDNAVLEVLQQKEDDDVSSKYILIKHDYYSSDSEHGRELLKSFFKAINNSRFNKVLSEFLTFFFGLFKRLFEGLLRYKTIFNKSLPQSYSFKISCHKIIPFDNIRWYNKWIIAPIRVK